MMISETYGRVGGRILLVIAACAVLDAAAWEVLAGDGTPNKDKYIEEISAFCSGEEFLTWSQQKVDGKMCRVSAAMEQPKGFEINHHRVTVDFVGTGTVELSVAHLASKNLKAAIRSPNRHSPLRKIVSGKEVMISSSYRGERCSWLILRTQGNVTIRNIRYTFWRGRGTLYGHSPKIFEFAGAKLPYRLMYPRNYDPKKTYPLVLSVSGSGGVGTGNVKNMEKVILARNLFTRYYFDREFECFSLVPQIPPSRAIPAPYWPRGDKGKPTRFHPDWPTVNENGWYTQASIALIRSLLADEKLNIDPDRVYYTGFSYGGKACWEFLKADRDLWAGAICGSGWPIGRAFRPVDETAMQRLKLEVQRYKHVPVLIFAGEKDRMNLGSKAVHKQILAQGGKSTYLEIPGAKHVQSSRAWNDRKNIAWLFRQNRKNNPKPGKDPFPGGVYVTDHR